MKPAKTVHRKTAWQRGTSPFCRIQSAGAGTDTSSRFAAHRRRTECMPPRSVLRFQTSDDKWQYVRGLSVPHTRSLCRTLHQAAMRTVPASLGTTACSARIQACTATTTAASEHSGNSRRNQKLFAVPASGAYPRNTGTAESQPEADCTLPWKLPLSVHALRRSEKTYRTGLPESRCECQAVPHKSRLHIA